MGGAWASLILLCTRAARQEHHTKIAGMVDGKPVYIDPALIPPEPEPDPDPEGGETEDAGY